MNPVEHFRQYLGRVSDERLKELRSIQIRQHGFYPFPAQVLTSRLREMVEIEIIMRETDRMFLDPEWKPKWKAA